MGPMTEAIVFIVQTLFHLYMLVVLLRFLLQVARADFYNPVSQFIVKVTNPPVKPLRRIIPGLAGLDLASLLLALMIQIVAISTVTLLLGYGLLNPLQLLLWAVVGTISFIVNIYIFSLIIAVIASWVAPGSYNPALMLISQLLEPVVGPIRRIMPDLGGIDISPIFVFLLLQVVQIFLKAVPLNKSLVLGI